MDESSLEDEEVEICLRSSFLEQVSDQRMAGARIEENCL